MLSSSDTETIKKSCVTCPASLVTCHLSCVTFHVSPVACCMSPVSCHLCHLLFLRKNHRRFRKKKKTFFIKQKQPKIVTYRQHCPVGRFSEIYILAIEVPSGPPKLPQAEGIYLTPYPLYCPNTDTLNYSSVKLRVWQCQHAQGKWSLPPPTEMIWCCVLWCSVMWWRKILYGERLCVAVLCIIVV